MVLECNHKFINGTIIPYLTDCTYSNLDVAFTNTI